MPSVAAFLLVVIGIGGLIYGGIRLALWLGDV